MSVRKTSLVSLFLLSCIAMVGCQNDHGDRMARATAKLQGFIQIKEEPATAKVYAVDTWNGEWFSAKSVVEDGEETFSLNVSPGTYYLFAFSESGGWGGYSDDGFTLTKLYVESDQQSSNILIKSPEISVCGYYFGLPASPDGHFEALAGASEDCLSALLENAPSFIEGQVKLDDEITPPMMIYAADPVTDKWFSIDMKSGSDSVSFSLKVPPGSYQIFAFSESGIWGGYTEDGSSLAVIQILPGRIEDEILIKPAIPSLCGPLFGVPASPDGRFEAIAGANPECLQALEDKLMCGNARPGDDVAFLSVNTNNEREEIALVTPNVAAGLDRAFSRLLSENDAYNTIFADELAASLGNDIPPFIIDVRTMVEVEQNGHIEGGVHIPLNELAKNLKSLPAFEVPIVTYCGSGWRSTIAMTALSAMGWENVRALKTPFKSWIEAGFPIRSGTPETALLFTPQEVNIERAAALDATLNVYGVPSFGIITSGGLASALENNPNLVVIDVRRPDEVAKQGQIDTGESVQINIPLERIVAQKEFWPSISADIVVYCGSGHRSTIAMMILGSYGYNRVYSLQGGFTTWEHTGFPTLQ